MLTCNCSGIEHEEHSLGEGNCYFGLVDPKDAPVRHESGGWYTSDGRHVTDHELRYKMNYSVNVDGSWRKPKQIKD